MRFHLAHQLLVTSKRSAFREPRIQQNFGAIGIWEKLLLHTGHTKNTECKNQCCSPNREPSMLHTPVHSFAKTLIKGAIEHLMGIWCKAGCTDPCLGFLQENTAQVRHKINRSKPAEDQSDHRHRENCKRVLARHGLGHANWQKARGRNQGSRQHGLCSDVVGKRG